jgi:hypothetical protein
VRALAALIHRHKEYWRDGACADAHFFRFGNTALTSQHDIFGRRYFVTLARRR